MTTLMPLFKNSSFPDTRILVSPADLIFFSDGWASQLESEINKGNTQVTLYLDLIDFNSVKVDDMYSSLKALERMYVHRAAKKGKLSQTYESAATISLTESFRNLSWECRNIILVLTSYLGLEAIYEICCKVYTEILVGLSSEEVRIAIGASTSKRVTTSQMQELRTIIFPQTSIPTHGRSPNY